MCCSASQWICLQFGRGHHRDGDLADRDTLAGTLAPPPRRIAASRTTRATPPPPPESMTWPSTIVCGARGRARRAGRSLCGSPRVSADFDRARPDVDPDRVLAFAHRASVPEVLARSDRLLHSGSRDAKKRAAYGRQAGLFATQPVAPQAANVGQSVGNALKGSSNRVVTPALEKLLVLTVVLTALGVRDARAHPQKVLHLVRQGQTVASIALPRHGGAPVRGTTPRPATPAPTGNRAAHRGGSAAPHPPQAERPARSLHVAAATSRPRHAPRPIRQLERDYPRPGRQGGEDGQRWLPEDAGVPTHRQDLGHRRAADPGGEQDQRSLWRTRHPGGERLPPMVTGSVHHRVEAQRGACHGLQHSRRPQRGRARLLPVLAGRGLRLLPEVELRPPGRAGGVSLLGRLLGTGRGSALPRAEGRRPDSAERGRARA